MKTFHRYLLKEIILVAFPAVAVLTFLFVMMNVRKDLLDLLLNNDISLWSIFWMILLLVPYVITYTLPWGLVMAVLIVFGRMSQDQEFMALKSSGAGLAFIIAPVILFALVCSFLSFIINGFIAPQCREAFKNYGYELFRSNPVALFVAEKGIDKIPKIRLYFGRKEGTVVEDVHIWQVNDQLVPISSLRAERGEIEVDKQNQRVILKLIQVRKEDRNPRMPEDVTKLNVGTRAQEFPLEISLREIMDSSRFAKRKGPGIMTMFDLRQFIFAPEDPEVGMIIPVLTEFQKRISLSMACFTLVLVGIPLALQTQRRETSIGVVLSVVIFAGYYGLIIVAETLKNKANFYPEVIIWSPNLIFQALGFYLLWRANHR